MRPWVLATTGYSALAVAATWPLARHLGDRVSAPIHDPLINSWILWWNLHAVPLTTAWWNAPMFYPTDGALALSEILLGLMPIAAPVQWLGGTAVLAHNVAVLVSFPLCAIAAHALAYEITRRHDAALLAGLIFGFSPVRGGEIGHVQALSYYWAPIALLALHRYSRTARAGWLALFAAAAVLQVFCNGHALFHLPVLVALWGIWFCRTARMRVGVAAASIAATFALLPVIDGYRDVHRALRLSRSIGDIVEFSADASALVSVPRDARLLGSVLALDPDMGLFPGATAMLLVAAGVVLRRMPIASPAGAGSNGPPRTGRARSEIARRLLAAIALVAGAATASIAIAGPWSIGPLSLTRPHKPLSLAIVFAVAYFVTSARVRALWRSRSAIAFYALAAVVFYVLALGPEPRLFGERIFYKAPYAWLMELPGYDAIRVPARFAQLGTLAIGVLAALIVARTAAAGRLPRPLLWAMAACLAAEGLLRVPLAPLPPERAPIAWPPVSAVVELPMSIERESAALYRSMGDGVPLVNGTSGYSPPQHTALIEAIEAGAVDVLRGFTGAGPIGVAVERTADREASLERAIRALPGVETTGTTREWALFVLPHSKPPEIPPGDAHELAAVEATPHADAGSRLHDGRIDTVWWVERQAGVESITVTLTRDEDVGAIQLQIGACPFAFPRRLAIDLSLDGQRWIGVSEGSAAAATVRAALADPRDVPVVIAFPASQARHVRLRQLASAPAPWCVGELSVHRGR